MHQVKANLWGLLPIFLFVCLVVITGLAVGDITAMPIVVAFFISAGFALLLNPKNETLSINDKISLFCKGGGNKNIILLVFIFLLAGAFYALTIDIGARDSTVNLALQFVPIHFILPGLFLICCFIAFAMGTSMGTVTALSPIGIGLAESLGVPIPLALGIVVGGAMFGDNLSFVSDTTIAATRSQGVELKDKFKANLIIAVPASLITLAILSMIDVNGAGDIETATYELSKVLPYIVIIVSALSGLNVITVLVLGIATAASLGVMHGDFTILTMLQSIQKGMGWMQELAIIAVIIGGIVALMQRYGGLKWLTESLTKKVETNKGAEFSIVGLVSVLTLSTANNTIAIVTAGPIAKELRREYGVAPKRTASLLDVFSCGFQGLVPYGGQLLSAAAIAGVSPLAITVYCWYPMLILLFGVVIIIFNLKSHQEQR